MPKGVKTLEHEIRNWQHYKKFSKWLDGTKPYKTFTHSVADEQIAQLEAQLEKAKAKAEAKRGGTRRRRHRTRSTRRR